ncbi:RDD family protein [Streptomyces sp. NPDC003077]|uniref:RDD family protein n=1 Tax=Streptomyces sp. NPDC003077 TaxID=3154443 RepID=UPI0033A34559
MNDQQIPPHASPYAQPHHYAAHMPPPSYPYPMPHPAGPPEWMLADQGARLGARLMDVVFVFLGMGIVGGAVSLVGALTADGAAQNVISGVLGFIGAAAWLLYEPVMNGLFGGTFGKRICGLRVVRLSDGAAVSFWRALGRWAIMWPMAMVPFLGILNALWCCWDKPYRQCLHDKVAGTVVVKRDMWRGVG